MHEGPVVIEVRGLSKAFRIPEHRVDTLKERVVRPFAQADVRELHALRDVSFDVRSGEAFGIVGRNGSGKSTLLKVLASIYGADAGRVRMAGRLAPFIELGVGFDPELTARENVALNGVLMGLSRREARRRLDQVLEFAELGDFAAMKLKNYSSGMMVRLAFSTMVQAQADVMLVDEVLAVGDAAFAQRCMDVFRERRAAGTTIVLVTHDMATVQSFCDRAMLLHDGAVEHLGDPEEAALRYYRRNFAAPTGEAEDAAQGVPDVNVRLVSADLAAPDGAHLENVEQGEPFSVSVVLEARHELVAPVFQLHVFDADGVAVLGFSRALDPEAHMATRVAPGERIALGGTLANPLAPGRYTAQCWIARVREEEDDLSLHVLRLFDFIVYGTRPGAGSVVADADVAAVLEPEAA